MKLFISFEGGEGCGKSTIINTVRKQLSNYSVFTMREPGSNPISEEIRAILLDPNNDEMTSETEALLYAASRAQTYKDIIKKMTEYDIILCDRFLDSSLVYQGIARGLGVNEVKKINDFALHGFRPDLTFFLDLEPRKAAERIKTRKLDRLEQENFSFHEDIYNGFKELAKNSNRIISIDATQSIEQVTNEILQHIYNYINYIIPYVKK